MGESEPSWPVRLCVGQHRYAYNITKVNHSNAQNGEEKPWQTGSRKSNDESQKQSDRRNAIATIHNLHTGGSKDSHHSIVQKYGLP